MFNICVIKYTTIYINLITVFITILLFSLINSFSFKVDNINFNATFETSKKENISFETENTNFIQEVQEIKIIQSTNEENIIKNSTNVMQDRAINENINSNWYIEIPAISLKANIEEGTTKEIMNKYVGHFEDMAKTSGNIGLAAHNRGYENNYFQGLKKLKIGDIIKYKYNNFEKNYIVKKHVIIKDTDWTLLENSEQNKITLITCVENEPEYRRCIQAIEN